MSSKSSGGGPSLDDVGWERKIAAFLYRPPDAGLHDEAGVVKRRDQLWTQINDQLGIDLYAHEGAARLADALAWAADRPPMQGVASPFRNNPVVRHPFSGEILPLISREPLDDATVVSIAQSVDATIIDILTGAQDLRTRFLALWRQLEDCLIAKEQLIGRNWPFMPADGRLSDAWLVHSATASAIAAAGDKPAFLIFTIAGTQDFISQSRRTQDFWMGSYLVALLSWAAARWLVDRFGPDMLILPTLHRQPLLDHRLTDQGVAISPPPTRDMLRIASLPNIFSAIVPEADAVSIAGEMTAALREERESVFARVEQELGGLPARTPFWTELWNGQRDEFLEGDLFWSIAPWQSDPHTAIEALRDEMEDDLGVLSDRVTTIEDIVAGGNAPGASFALDAGLAAQGLSARKNLRAFPRRPAWPTIDACSLCAQRPAMHSNESDTMSTGHEAWKSWHRSRPDWLRSGERLCAVCLVKRLGEIYLRESLNLGARSNFPSTPTIATTSFREAVLATADLAPDVRKFVEALQDAFGIATGLQYTVTGSTTPPRLERSRKNPLSGGIEDTALISDFLSVDGIWFYPDSYDPEGLQREAGSGTNLDTNKVKSARECLAALLTAAERYGIRKPSIYYAVIVVDGDKSGEWVGGNRNPTYEKVLHPDIIATVGAEPWLTQQRPAGPGSQVALARALNDFALHAVPQIVEQRYPGKLIYAGGDDVLALVPLWNHRADESNGEPANILDLVDELRSAFRNGGLSDNHIGLGDHLFQVRGKEVPAASLSAGVSIVHHSAPLAGQLHKTFAESLKQHAKHDFDRNAVALDIYTRSGPSLSSGVRWGAGSTNDLMTAFKMLVRLLAPGSDRVISPQLGLDLERFADVMAADLVQEADERRKGLAREELRDLVERHSRGTTTDRQAIGDDLIAIANGLVAMCRDLPAADPWKMLAALLKAAQILQREG